MKQLVTLFNAMREVNAILSYLNRRHELQRLIRWAQHKKLKRPLWLYQRRLEEVERRLFHCQFPSSNTVKVAQALHMLHRLLHQKSRYMARGSAASYRYLSR